MHGKKLGGMAELADPGCAGPVAGQVEKRLTQKLHLCGDFLLTLALHFHDRSAPFIG